MTDAFELGNSILKSFRQLVALPTLDATLALLIERQLLQLFRCNADAGKHFVQILMIHCRPMGRDKDAVFYSLVNTMFKIKDKFTQKQMARFVMSKGNIEALSYYLTKRTRVKVDLHKSDTIKSEHLAALGDIISCLGINLIYCDLVRSKNLLHILSLNQGLVESFEKHLISKSKRYRTYLALTKYVQMFDGANKRKILTEVFKERNHFKAKLALQRLRAIPELEKFFSMK